MNKKTSPKRVAIVALVIGLPLLFIFLLGRGAFKSNHTLPYLGDKVYDPVKQDTLYHTVPDFNLQSHTGDSISLKNFEGQIMVVNFFFTTCPDVCPKMNSGMSLVYDKYKNAPDIRFLSISVDPKNDTLAALKTYAGKLLADNGHWLFARNNSQDYILELSKGFLIKTSGENGYEHDPYLILIDHKKHVRGLYDGTDVNAVNTLKEDIKLLVSERNAPDSTKR